MKVIFSKSLKIAWKPTVNKNLQVILYYSLNLKLSEKLMMDVIWHDGHNSFEYQDQTDQEGDKGEKDHRKKILILFQFNYNVFSISISDAE